jgi:hypothetical protein
VEEQVKKELSGIDEPLKEVKENVDEVTKVVK